jgi:hypothetical protein
MQGKQAQKAIYPHGLELVTKQLNISAINTKQLD